MDSFAPSNLLDLARRHGALKIESYFTFYSELFEPWRGRAVKLLELGVFQGGSIKTWCDFFPDGTICGLDGGCCELRHPRFHFFQGAQDDLAVLTAVNQQHGPFDIIIDDCSHDAGPTRASFQYLFKEALKPRGLYVIEDWGTGYWSHWPSGQDYVPGTNHTAGLVGFIKELIDEVGYFDVHRHQPDRPSKIARLTVVFGQAVITKA